MKELVHLVDIIIYTDQGIPLIRRKYEPYKDFWAIPGGHLDKEDLISANWDFEKALMIAAKREAREEFIEGEVEIIKKIGIYDEGGRDPRGDNYVTHAYLARIICGTFRPGSDSKEVRLFKNMPRPMAFDHEKILTDSKVFENFTYDKV